MKENPKAKSTKIMRMSLKRGYGAAMILLTVLALNLNIPNVYADDRTASPAVPQVISVSPDSASGLRQEFRFRYSDTTSRDLLGTVNFLFGDSKDDSNALFVTVELAEQKMRLGEEGRFTNSFVDDGILGEAKTLSSSHVDINLQSALRNNIASRDIEIVVTLDFSGKSFRGNKKIYMQAIDLQNEETEYLQLGNYTIEDPTTNNAPRNIDVTPDNGEGKNQSFRIRVRDNDGVTDIREMIVVFSKNDDLHTGVQLTMHLYPRTNLVTAFVNDQSFSGTVGEDHIFISPYFTLNLANTYVLRAPPDDDGVRKVLQFHPAIKFKARTLGEWKIFSYVVDSRGRSDGFERLGKFTVPGGRIGVRGLYTIPGKSRGPYDDGIEDRVKQKFICVWYDLDGRDDIRWLQFKLSPNADQQADIFHFAIDVESASPRVILWNDFGVQGPWSRPGRSRVLSNSQGSVYMNSFVLSPLGSNQYRAEFEVTFDRSFRGAHKIYMRGEDFADNASPWRRKGKYVITNNDRRPGVDAISPVIASGVGTRFVFRWTDPDGPNDIKYGDVWFGPDPEEDGIRLTYDHARHRIEVSANGGTVSAPPGAPIGEILAGGLKAQLDRVYVFKEGDELVLSIDVLFDPDDMDNPGFNLIHLRSRDFRGQESRWFARGSYTVTDTVVDP